MGEPALAARRSEEGRTVMVSGMNMYDNSALYDTLRSEHHERVRRAELAASIAAAMQDDPRPARRTRAQTRRVGIGRS